MVRVWTNFDPHLQTNNRWYILNKGKYRKGVIFWPKLEFLTFILFLLFCRFIVEIKGPNPQDEHKKKKYWIFKFHFLTFDFLVWTLKEILLSLLRTFLPYLILSVNFLWFFHLGVLLVAGLKSNDTSGILGCVSTLKIKLSKSLFVIRCKILKKNGKTHAVT